MILTIAGRAAVGLLAAGALTLTACDPDTPPGSGPIVVATTTQVADLARSVAGERARVVGIVSPNADPHEYEPRPSDAAALADSELILVSGGDLDAWADDLIESSGSDAPVLTLIDGVVTIPGPGGDPDPHWWHDPRNAVLAVGLIAERLAAVDPGGERAYRTSTRRYVRRIERLDSVIARCMDRIPVARRKLVSGHDSLAYLADRYGIAVAGSALPALTTQAQASAGAVAQLADLIKAERVPVVFAESGLSHDLIGAIADQAGVGLGGELHADSLGPSESDVGTYLGAMAANARALVAGLGEGGVPCSLLR